MRARIETDFFNPARPRIIAHRGASSLYPENTIPAFRAAREIGADYIELDIHLTCDGDLVVSHDGDLERTCGSTGLIRQMRLCEIREADAGYTFNPPGRNDFPFRGRGITLPTLGDVFSELPDRFFIVEIKPDSTDVAEPLLEVIERSAMSRRVLVASEHDAPLGRFREIAPHIPTNLGYREIVAFVMSLAPGGAPYVPVGQALEIPLEYESWKLVTAESIAAAHRLGLEVHVWTVDDELEMRSLLALGVDGIITNWPQRLCALREQRKR
jgi:glycerophosphoryl diester phosphodiesterase